MAVAPSAAGNDAKAGAGTGGCGLLRSDDYRRVDLVRRAVAIDCRARGAGDNRTDAAAQSAPGKPVDKWILQRLEGGDPT